MEVTFRFLTISTSRGHTQGEVSSLSKPGIWVYNVRECFADTRPEIRNQRNGHFTLIIVSIIIIISEDNEGVVQKDS